MGNSAGHKKAAGIFHSRPLWIINFYFAWYYFTLRFDFLSSVLTQDEIFEKTRDVLMEALVVDAEEVTAEASLTGDLQAESIDFLDIVFRLEKAFTTNDKAFKISQGELFPENLMENPDWVTEGKITDAGMSMLRDRMPHVDFSAYEDDRDIDKVAELITVGSMVEFVNRKLSA